MDLERLVSNFKQGIHPKIASPAISVIFYIGANYKHWKAALQSIDEQSFRKYELFIICDYSLKYQLEAAAISEDSRFEIKYFQKEANIERILGRCVLNSLGDFVAFLDANHLYHKDRLRLHVENLQKNPSICLSHNGHYVVNSVGKVTSIIRPQDSISFAELILGRPIHLSDVVIRRHWAIQSVSFLENCLFCDEGFPYISRLLLAGCEFASVNRTLSYQISDKINEVSVNLQEELQTKLGNLEVIFEDPNCPKDGLLILCEKALAKIYLEYSFEAYVQNDAAFAKTLIRKSISLDRSILDLEASKYREFLICKIIVNDCEPEKLLRRIFDDLPFELAWVTQYADETIAHAYLRSGLSAIMWGRNKRGSSFLRRARALDVNFNIELQLELLQQLSPYEDEFGKEATEIVLQDWHRYLSGIMRKSITNRFISTYVINRAFDYYFNGEYKSVHSNVLRAIILRPFLLINRGVLSIFGRSLIFNFLNR